MGPESITTRVETGTSRQGTAAQGLPQTLSFSLRNRALATALIVFLLHGLLAIVVVPPWQNPDEPQHMEFVRILASGSGFDLSKRMDIDVEREILRSMDAHNWWTYIGYPRPGVPPNFRETPFLLYATGGGVQNPPLYYCVTAGVLKALRISSLDRQYFAARLLSLFFGLIALLVIWCALDLGHVPRQAGNVVVAMIALHPQFILSMTAVNPDSLAVLLGAVAFLGLALLRHRGGVRAWSLVLLALAGTLGVLTKRTAAPLSLWFCGAFLIHVFDREVPASRRIATIVLAIILPLVLALALARFAPDELRRTVSYSLVVLKEVNLRSAIPHLKDPRFLFAFGATLHDSFWLRAGWMIFGPHPLWAGILRGVVLLGVLGLAWGWWRPGRRPAGWRMAMDSLAAVLIFLAAVMVGYYLRGELAQGRYLFAAEAPIMLLLWTGWRSALSTPLCSDRVLAGGLLALWLLFAFTSWERLFFVFQG